MKVFLAKSNVLSAVVLSALATSALNAAGFEKNVLWSGKYQGRGGAATSSVNDSQALFFNPAGLSFIDGKGDVYVNFSPTFASFKGPVLTNNVEETSKTSFSPIGGITSAWRLNEKIVLAGGAFVSGGTQSKFEVTTPSGNGTSESSLSLIDFAIGGAYKVTDNFSLGASWKATYAQAELASIIMSAMQVKFKNLKDWNFAGFRVGGQYRTENFGIGLNVRTPIDLTLEGDGSIYAISTPASVANDPSVNVKASFPMQVALGADFKASDVVTIYFDASWTNYGNNTKLAFSDISWSSPNPFVAPIQAGLLSSGIPLNWHDQQVVRLGADWKLNALTLRGGYVLTSQVTASQFARATFSSPGLGHTFTLGAGTEFGSLKVDAAVDYSLASGSVPASGSTLAGKYSASSYTAHLGVGYTF